MMAKVGIAEQENFLSKTENFSIATDFFFDC